MMVEKKISTLFFTCEQYGSFSKTKLKQIDVTEAPETLVSILRCLGETLTAHVACTTWDKQFRLALVASSLPIDYKFESQEFFTKKSQVRIHNKEKMEIKIKEKKNQEKMLKKFKKKKEKKQT